MEFRDYFADVEYDLWQHLNSSGKPVVLYGMGDGADKILAILSEKGIKPQGIFASDGFVRKKVFHGMELESYSDIKKRLTDFTVLVSFGTKLPEVLSCIKNISLERELYAPDVPVFGGGLMDMEYFKANFDRFENVYKRLCGEISKKTYALCLKYRLTGNIDYLFECETDKEYGYHLFAPTNNSSYIDIGAYNGDTIREFSSYSGNSISVFAFEPDARNFKKLSEYAESSEIKEKTLFNCAAWDKNEMLTFYSRSGRNCANTSHRENLRSTEIQAIRPDSVCGFATHIKIDAEGSDIPALTGCSDIIKKYAPALKIAAYHRTDDYFSIPEAVLSVREDYDVYFLHTSHIPAWDTDFYFIKRS